MGKGRIEIKTIENQTNRQVTFSKRRKGLFKKASELSILCEAEVGVIVFSNTGKLFEYTSSSMKRIAEKYSRVSGLPLWENEHERMVCQLARQRMENEQLHARLRRMKGEDLETVPQRELINLEQTLQDAAKKVRDRKMDRMNYQFNQTKKRVLGLQQQSYVLNQQVTGNHNGYGQIAYEAEEQIPLGIFPPEAMFRVQPNQPNLQYRGY